MTFTAANLCKQYQAALLLSAKSKPEREISRVFCTSEKYEVKLDIQNFHPDEIAVSAVKGFLIVNGMHEERGEKLGLIKHQFTRRYVLPNDVRCEDITCTLGSDGILTLSAPRKHIVPVTEIKIPIEKNEGSGATVFDVTSPQKERSTGIK